jgi:hypothetical protein
MPRLNAANRAHTTLDGAINDSTTSINVVDASVFSAPPFRAVIKDGDDFEVVEVTGITTNTLTVVTRGSLPFPDDTSAAAWGSGAVIAQEQTAGYADELASALGHLSDVDLTGATEGDALTLGAGDIWVPGSPASSGGSVVVIAQNDEIVNNSATLQNDDELFVSVGANELWMFRLSLLLQQTTGANPPNGWRHTVAIPSGAEATRWVLQDTQAFGIDATGSVALSQTGTALYAVNVMYRLITGETPGTFQHQWAQNVAHASDSFRRRGSMLRGWKA